MKICGEEIDLSGSPVNPEIRHLWDLENTGYADHARACSAYSLWMADYDEIQIATFLNVSVEEIRADLAHIRAVLPEEAVLLHTREREEIRDSVKSAKKLREELAADLSVPIDELIKQGKDPIRALRRYREAVAWDDESIQLRNLRNRDTNPDVDAKADHLADEEERELIAALRQEGKQRVKNAKMKDRLGYSASGILAMGIDKQSNPCNRPNERQCQSKSIPAENKRKGGKRITVRVNDDLYRRILETAQSLGIDISTMMRELLERGLESGLDVNGTTTAAGLAIIPEAFQYSPPFRAFCGDLRPEFKKRFLTLIALGHEATQRWRTAWVRKLFLGLLPLQKHLEDEIVGQ